MGDNRQGQMAEAWLFAQTKFPFNFKVTRYFSKRNDRK